MKSYRLSAAAALVMAVGCGGSNGGSGPANQAPTANFGAPTCTQLSCAFTDASTDADGTIASRAWTFENGTPATSTDPNPTVTFAAGTQTVTLTVTDNDGDSGNFSRDVTVMDVPGNANPTADFTFSCSSLDCTFNDASSDTDGTIASWAWDFGDGSTAATQNTTHTYTATSPDTFAVRLIATDNGGASDTVTPNIVVAPPAACQGTACDLTLQADAKVTVTLTSEGCNAPGNTLRITAPIDTTLFTNGCQTPAGTSYDLGGTGNVFTSGTTIVPEVISGSSTLAFPPTLRLKAGTGYPTWVLEFDDGEGCGAADPTCGGTEPDFNDLVITITATP